MARILSIDYGKKRTGIAVTDPLKIIANGLTTVPTHELVGFLKNYFQKEAVEKVIIGLPKQMNNQPSEICDISSRFVAQFNEVVP